MQKRSSIGAKYKSCYTEILIRQKGFTTALSLWACIAICATGAGQSLNTSSEVLLQEAIV